MKKLKILIINLIIVLQAISLYSQDSTNISFYPLQVENIWEYEEYDGTFFYDSRIKIVSDTLINDSNYFKLIYNNFWGETYTVFERINDSLEVVSRVGGDLYETLMLKFKLNSGLGEKWTVNFSVDSTSIVTCQLDSIYDEEIFGELRENHKYRFEHRIIESNELISSWIEILTQDLGVTKLIWIEGTMALENATRELIGAIINGRKYGSISSIYTDNFFRKQKISFKLKQNYPNPFNSETLIYYELLSIKPGNATLKIFNIKGELLLEFLNDSQSKGKYYIKWSGRDSKGNVCPSGMYFYKLKYDNIEKTRKMILKK